MKTFQHVSDETFRPFEQTKMVTVVFALVIAIAVRASGLNDSIVATTELPEPMKESNIFYISSLEDEEARASLRNASTQHAAKPMRIKNRRKNSAFNEAVRVASLQGFNAMIDLYERKEPEILRKGQPIKSQKISNVLMRKSISGEFLDANHPATKLSLFSAPMTNESDAEVKGAYASLFAAKKLQER